MRPLVYAAVLSAVLSFVSIKCYAVDLGACAQSPIPSGAQDSECNRQNGPTQGG